MSSTSDERPWMSEECGVARRLHKFYPMGQGYSKEDLIRIGLEQGQDMDDMLKCHLLGQPNFDDLRYFVQNLEGCMEADWFRDYSYRPVYLPPTMLHSRAVCKFVICDGRIADMDTFDGDSNAAMERLYQEQLHLEATNDVLERARAAVRSREQKAATELAKIMLAQYDKQLAEQGYYDVKETWKQIAPKTPAWIDEICVAQEKYGFVVFESSKLRKRTLQGIVQWYRVFNGLSHIDHSEWTGRLAAAKTVKDGYKLILNSRLQFEKEPVDEDDPESIRRRFLELVPTLPGKISKTTFLVITDDCVFQELDTNELWLTKRLRWPTEREQGMIAYQDLPPFFVWAYDAAWTPPTGAATIDADGYQGRLRVDATVVLSWFYYARTYTDFTMKQLWEKAQHTPHKVWHVLQNLVNKAESESLV